MRVTIPISVGELLDKITILEIKNERIADARKRANVEAELALLVERRQSLGLAGAAEAAEIGRLVAELGEVNRRLWEVEDRLRALEQRSDFGEAFVALARSVYRENDRRADLKRRLNELTGSELVEEKSYSAPASR